MSSSHKIDVQALVKDIPKCDFIGNSIWKKGVESALSNAQLSHCLTMDLDTQLNYFVVAKVLTTAAHWAQMKRMHPDILQGDGKDYWYIPITENSGYYMCKAKFEMSLAAVNSLSGTYRSASEII
jgi:hypothetical protein